MFSYDIIVSQYKVLYIDHKKSNTMLNNALNQVYLQFGHLMQMKTDPVLLFVCLLVK